jgi:hypothetical protein
VDALAAVRRRNECETLTIETVMKSQARLYYNLSSMQRHQLEVRKELTRMKMEVTAYLHESAKSTPSSSSSSSAQARSSMVVSASSPTHPHHPPPSSSSSSSSVSSHTVHNVGGPRLSSFATKFLERMKQSLMELHFDMRDIEFNEAAEKNVRLDITRCIKEYTKRIQNQGEEVDMAKVSQTRHITVFVYIVGLIK